MCKRSTAVKEQNKHGTRTAPRMFLRNLASGVIFIIEAHGHQSVVSGIFPAT